MKFNIDIDATPAEARAFLGLPDLTPLHDMWIEEMKKFTLDGAGRDAWAKLAKNWAGGLPFLSDGIEGWQNMFKAAMQGTTSEKTK